MSLRNADQIKTVGQTNYVPPEVFSSWTVGEQINYVAGQSKLGYTVKAAVFSPVNINSLNDLLRLNYSAKENFATELQAQFNLPDSQVPLAVQKALQDLVIVTDTLRTTIRNASGYTPAELPEGYVVTDAFNITNKRIQRVGETNDDHFLTASDFKKIFNHCLTTWKDDQTVPDFRFRRSHGSLHTVDIRSNRVEIGCQTLLRHEAESIASALGFYGIPFSD